MLFVRMFVVVVVVVVVSSLSLSLSMGAPGKLMNRLTVLWGASPLTLSCDAAQAYQGARGWEALEHCQKAENARSETALDHSQKAENARSESLPLALKTHGNNICTGLLKTDMHCQSLS